ncbi:Metallo-hydrolase/oxidoreductase [Cerioporus squamosus]|nr:Metallo-hydrolase/oxidoreductase [Cerioporus squamosus]
MTKDAQETFTLPEPRAGQPYIKVSALEAGILELIHTRFMAGSRPGESTMCPSLAFSLVHSTTGEHLVFDMGIRRDMDVHPPAVQKSIKGRVIKTPQSVDESLRKGGIDPADVKTVIVSHLHYDHVGDAAAFPNATFIMGGDAEEFLAHTYPTNPASNVLQTSIPISRTRFIGPSELTESIEPFPRAYDYFGDGSMYVVDAAGHLPGHVNIFARTNATGSWIYLAGDTAHDMALLTGEREVAFSFDEAGHMVCAHVDKDRAIEHIARVRQLLGVPKVQVLLAHDYVWYEANKGGEAFLPGEIPPKL